MLADLIKAVVKSEELDKECISTESLLSKIEDAAKTVKEKGRNVVLFSIDAKALYPNINIKRAAKETGKKVMESKAEFKNIDYKAAATYLTNKRIRDSVALHVLKHFFIFFYFFFIFLIL